MENTQNLLQEQQEYTALAKELINKKYDMPEHAPLAMVVTYGCQQNVSDSERLKGMLSSIGYAFTEDMAEADLILFNTCAVREHAEDRVFGNVGALKHYKKRNPSLIIGICGCMAQQPEVRERIKLSFPYVDLLFGTHVSYRLPECLYRLFTKKERVFEADENNNAVVEGTPIRRDGTFKGWLPIMYGCNNFCTYCIVPYVRGRERSRSYKEIVSEMRDMVNNGFRDITLLGQNVNSYKSPENAPDGSEVGFPELLYMLNEIKGDFRIRFMTSHPKDCSENLLLAMSKCDKVCHHLHLPFQSGSNNILKIMNRRYTAEKYFSLIEKARELMPDICLTSDIIVGFPGEKYEDFLKTVELIKKVKFTALFTFIFSSRPGTPAAKMDDPVSRKEKGVWFRELLKAQDEIAAENEKKLANKKFRILCDDYGRSEGCMTGRTDGNISLEFEASPDMLGKFAEVETFAEDGQIKSKIIPETVM